MWKTPLKRRRGCQRNWGNFSLLTTAEAGVVVGKSQSAIQEMIRQEKLAARKIGGEYRIKKADLFVGAV